MESSPASPSALPDEAITGSVGLIAVTVDAADVPPGSTRLATWNTSHWRAAAACSNMETNLFFPVGEGIMALDQINLAKSVCASCPVRLECLEFAIRTIQNDGIWGGTTEDERRVIKRSRRAAARRAAAARDRPQAQAS